MKADRLIYLLSMANLTLRTYIHNELARAGVALTLPQAGLLFLLKEKDGRIMSELSLAIGVDNSAMTGLVDRLEKAGCVERRPNPGDRRTFVISITPEGLKEARKAEGVMARVNREIKAGFSDQDIEAFRSVLSAFFEKFRAR